MPYDCCITLDNRYLLCSLPNFDIEVFDLKTLEHCKTLTGHKSTVPYISLSVDGNYLVSASSTETIVWNAKTLESLFTIEE